jgi:hypothetical protein
LRTVALNFFFNCWYLEMPLDNRIRHLPRSLTGNVPEFLLDLEAVPQSCILYVQIGLSIALYNRSLLFVGSFDLRPSNQYILVRVIPSCFCFTKMCLCQVESPGKV